MDKVKPFDFEKLDNYIKEMFQFENQSQEQPESEDELWEQVVNIVVSSYEKWKKHKSFGRGDFGEAQLKKQFKITRK